MYTLVVMLEDIFSLAGKLHRTVTRENIHNFSFLNSRTDSYLSQLDTVVTSVFTQVAVFFTKHYSYQGETNKSPPEMFLIPDTVIPNQTFNISGKPIYVLGLLKK